MDVYKICHILGVVYKLINNEWHIHCPLELFRPAEGSVVSCFDNAAVGE